MRMARGIKLITRYSLIKLLVPGLLLLSTAPAVAANSSVDLATGEFQNFRRICIQFPVNGRTPGSFPVLTEDRENGRFSIEVVTKDSARYVGRDNIREIGKLPVRIKVSQIEADRLLFNVESIPYDKIASYYVLGSNQIIYDVYTTRPAESALLEKSVGLQAIAGNRDSGTVAVSAKTTGTSLSIREILDPKNRPLFTRAILFSLLISLLFLLVLLFMIGVTRSLVRKTKAPVRKAKSSSRPRPRPVAPAAAPEPVTPPNPYTAPPVQPEIPRPRLYADYDYDFPVLRTPEDRDRAIRGLMARHNISYDEAAMILMMKPGNLNVKV